MAVTVTDDKGREVRLEGDWTGRLVGQDFTNGGQIMAWLRPGADGWAEPVVAPPKIHSAEETRELRPSDYVEAIGGIIAEENRKRQRALPKGD